MITGHGETVIDAQGVAALDDFGLAERHQRGGDL